MLHKIRKETHAEFMTLFRMELAAGNVILDNRGSELIAVMTGGQDIIGIPADHVIGMHKVEARVLLFLAE
jgi:hypothetical protein